MQNKLNAVNWQKVGFIDASVKVNTIQQTQLNQNLFTVKQTGNAIMDQFLSAVTDIKIYGEADQNKCYEYRHKSRYIRIVYTK